MKLSDLRNKTVTVPLPFGDPGDTLVVRPNVVSSNFLAEFMGLDDKAATKEEITAQFDDATALLCQVVVNWDLTDEDGHPVALTPEAIKANDVSLPFQVACIRAAVQAVGESPATKAP